MKGRRNTPGLPAYTLGQGYIVLLFRAHLKEGPPKQTYIGQISLRKGVQIKAHIHIGDPVCKEIMIEYLRASLFHGFQGKNFVPLVQV